jgi:hypothetical protein
MTWEGWITLTTVVSVLYMLARNTAGPDVILMGGALLLCSLSTVSALIPLLFPF